MILALDVGNTNITCGVFDGDRIKASFRITTKMPRTSDEYGMLLSTLLERNQVDMMQSYAPLYRISCIHCRMAL